MQSGCAVRDYGLRLSNTDCAIDGSRPKLEMFPSISLATGRIDQCGEVLVYFIVNFVAIVFQCCDYMAEEKLTIGVRKVAARCDYRCVDGCGK